MTVIPEADFLQICDLIRKSSWPGSTVSQIFSGSVDPGL
jgi:hypothetical protein